MNDSPFLELTDSHFVLNEDAYPRLLATMYFPECHASINQTTKLIMSERDRWKSKERKEFSPSEFSQIFTSALKPRSAQVYLAGWIGIALGLRVQHVGSTQAEDAYSVVAQILKNHKRTARFVDWGTGEPQLKETQVSFSKTSMKNALKACKAVLPICAAVNAMAPVAGSLPIAVEAPETERRFINTVIFFQSWLGDVYEVTGWRRWLIDPNGHTHLAEAQEQKTPTFLSEQFLAEGFAAYAEVFPGYYEKQGNS